MSRSGTDDDESISSENTPARGSAAGAVIAGVVRGAGGKPVAGALVSLTSDVGNPDVAQNTGEDGAFRFGGLQPGRYVVHANADEGEGHRSVNVRGEEEHEADVKL